jgi:uncharacterized protein YqeY
MLLDRIAADLKDAMRKRDETRLRTLRSVRSAAMNLEIELRTKGRTDLTDDEVVTVLQKQAKQRRDAIDQYDAGGRKDLSDREREELEIIESYLPAQLSDEEIRSAVTTILLSVGASSPGDMGKVMGPAMKELRGKADGRRVQEVVRELLAGE